MTPPLLVTPLVNCATQALKCFHLSLFSISCVWILHHTHHFIGLASHNISALQELLLCTIHLTSHIVILSTSAELNTKRNTISLVDASSQHVFSTPTFKKKTAKRVNLKDLKLPSELAALKKNDVFSYYSIPCVRKAAIFSKSVDLSTVQESTSSTVKRESSISFESYMIFIVS